MGESSKFSLIHYARNFQSLESIGGDLAPSAAKEGEERFEQCVEEVRNHLIAPRGKPDEEGNRYSDSLNRAVLGYPEERNRFLAIIGDYVAKRRWNHLSIHFKSHQSISEAIFSEVIGLNVLELVLKNRAGLEEIQVVGTRIYEVRRGVPKPSEHCFRNLKEVERLQQNLVLYNNDTITPRKRWAEVRMLDGTRVTMTGFGFTSMPTLTMRFYTAQHFALAELCSPTYRTMDERVLTIIQAVLAARFNLVITGPTNSGKTHLLKSLIAELPKDERLITIESRFELALSRDFPDKNVIEYEIAEEDRLHGGTQAFKLALRQSPERICHAEIRDEDANIYVKACTRGHEGSMTTVHCSELEDAPDAIADMCMMDGRSMNSTRLTKRIAQFVTQIGIQMSIVEGSRKIVRIGEFGYEQDQVIVRDIVRYSYESDCWELPEPLSLRSAERIRRVSPAMHRLLVEQGVIEAC
jgi:pilus assembly protein CpaF